MDDVARQYGLEYEARMASLKGGLREYAVEYEGKLFLMATAAARDEFLQKPWRFADLELPTKLPPKEIKVALSMLPTQVTRSGILDLNPNSNLSVPDPGQPGP